MSVDTNSITTSRAGALGALGVLVRPENYLVLLFAVSTTLWTVAFLAYYLSTQVVGGFAAIARAAHCASTSRIARPR